MQEACHAFDLGKKDAEQFIRSERIDYGPFVAISDIHLVRKTIPPSFQALQKTVSIHDAELGRDIGAAAGQHAEHSSTAFSFDRYAAGFAAGVAAVWEKIRNDVLSER